MNRFGAFFSFLAHGFSSFLGLSADCLGSFLSFVSDGFSGLFCFLSNILRDFFGFLARGFNSVLDRPSRFFCSVLCLFYCAFLAEGGESRGHYRGNSKDRYFHHCFPFIAVPFTKKTDSTSLARALSRVDAATSSREVRATSRATLTFVNRREFFQWDAEDIKRCDQSISQS